MSYVLKLMEGGMPLWVVKAALHSTSPEEYLLLYDMSGIYHTRLRDEFELMKKNREDCITVWKKYRLSVKDFDWETCKDIIFLRKIPMHLEGERVWTLSLVMKIWRFWAKKRTAWMGNLQCEDKEFQRKFVNYCPWVDWKILSEIIENERNIQTDLIFIDKLRTIDTEMMQGHNILSVPAQYWKGNVKLDAGLEKWTLVSEEENVLLIHDRIKKKFENSNRSSEDEMPSMCEFAGNSLFCREGEISSIKRKEILFFKIKRELETWNRYMSGFYLSAHDSLYFRETLIAIDISYQKWGIHRQTVLSVTNALSKIGPSPFVFDKQGWPIGENWFDPDLSCSLSSIFPQDVALIVEMIYRNKVLFFSSYLPQDKRVQTVDLYALNVKRDDYFVMQLFGSLDPERGYNIPVHGFTQYSGGCIPIHFVEPRHGKYGFTAGFFEGNFGIVLVPDGCFSMQITKFLPSMLMSSVLVVREHLINTMVDHKDRPYFKVPGFTCLSFNFPKDTLLWFNIQGPGGHSGCSPFYTGLPVVQKSMSEIMATDGECVTGRMRCCGRKLRSWYNDGWKGIERALAHYLTIDEPQYFPQHLFMNSVQESGDPLDWEELVMGFHKINELCFSNSIDGGYNLAGGVGPRGKAPPAGNHTELEGKDPRNPHDYYYLMAYFRGDIDINGYYHKVDISEEKVVMHKVTYERNLIFQDLETGEAIYENVSFGREIEPLDFYDEPPVHVDFMSYGPYDEDEERFSLMNQ